MDENMLLDDVKLDTMLEDFEVGHNPKLKL
jgi:hypothetical protein